MEEEKQSQERPPMNHDLKVWPEFYPAMSERTKNFEIRKNDRDYRVGDRTTLRLWDPETNLYSGPQLQRTITHIMSFADVPVPILNSWGANPLPADMSNLVFLSLR